MQFLSVSNISKRLGENEVVDQVSFTQQKRQQIAIAGETGSGKTTLLKIIAGLEQCDTGEVLLEGEKVWGPQDKLIPGHPRIAYLSQFYELRNHYRVEELMEYANQLPEGQAQTLFELCRIDHLLKRWTHQLSGGEKQRIALARLLLTSPSLLILDEPFSNLDMTHKAILKTILQDIGEVLQLTTILTSHDPLDMLSWAEEMLILKNGAVVQQGPPRTLYEKPVNEYVAGLLGRYNLVPASRAGDLSTIPGIYPQGRSMLIRPEQLHIVESGPGTIKAIVQKTRFMGGYYEADLVLPGTLLTIHTAKAGLKRGDVVFITLNPDSVCYFR